MNPYARYGFLTAGIVFVNVGIVGLFLPILQGVLFIALGFYFLSLSSRRLKRTIESHLSRFPRAHRVYSSHRAKIDRIFMQKAPKKGSETGQGGGSSY